MTFRASFAAVAIAIAVSAAAFAGTSTESRSMSEVAVASSVSTRIGPSGLPVPRFVALRSDRVIARFGPSFNYPIAYEFSQRGLPLKVIAEDSDDVWRRVEDRDGRRMWIHRSMLSANQNAVVSDEFAILRAAPRLDAQGRAKLAGGVMLKIENCEAGWCRLRTDDFRGWLPEDALWGARI